MSKEIEFGILLPHFSDRTSREKLVGGTKYAEDLGFDVGYLRDHVFISPEHPSRTGGHGAMEESGFITESLTTIGALSTVTDSIKLGTAVLIPNRHPVKAAQIIGTLSFLSDDRIVVGLGKGWDKNEFSAVNMPYDKRPQMVRENVEIFRKLWNEDDVTYDGEVFEFEAVTIDPKPRRDPPILFGGLNFQAVNWAAEFCDGWLPNRLPYYRLKERLERLDKLTERYGRDERPIVGVIPQTSIARTSKEARDGFDLDLVKHEALKRKPIRGDKSDFTREELEGFIIWGEPAEICEHVERFIDLGVDQITFDIRPFFDEYRDRLALLGDEVIPEFR